jgi:predicted RNA-binding Zn ribbon-like protein
MTSTQWHGDTESKPAPDPLRRVQSLINTLDLETGQDRLANVDDARPWLVDNGLLAADAALGAGDLRLVADVREALRVLVHHNAGGPAADVTALTSLRAVTEAGTIRAVVDERGRVSLNGDGGSVRARLLSLLVVVRDAQLGGTWTHLKACANEDCLWAFYDRSRNHGGTWCDMATCGNKLKNRDFRARRRQSR